MTFRNRGHIGLPFLRLNWSRNGLRYRLTSHTWHIGRWSRNVRHDTGSSQARYNHWGPGWWEGKRKKGKR